MRSESRPIEQIVEKGRTSYLPRNPKNPNPSRLSSPVPLIWAFCSESATTKDTSRAVSTVTCVQTTRLFSFHCDIEVTSRNYRIDTPKSQSTSGSVDPKLFVHPPSSSPLSFSTSHLIDLSPYWMESDPKLWPFDPQNQDIWWTVRGGKSRSHPGIKS